MENQNFENKEKRNFNNTNRYSNQDTEKEYRHKKHNRNDRYKNQKFPFNFRHFVPEIQIENMHENPEYIRVISYNILCDSLLPISTQIEESDLVNYPYMIWENRRKIILAELVELNGDVVCLQEFERDENFITAMGNLGYDVKINFLNF